MTPTPAALPLYARLWPLSVLVLVTLALGVYALTPHAAHHVLGLLAGLPLWLAAWVIYRRRLADAPQARSAAAFGAVLIVTLATVVEVTVLVVLLRLIPLSSIA